MTGNEVTRTDAKSVVGPIAKIFVVNKDNDTFGHQGDPYKKITPSGDLTTEPTGMRITE